MHTEQSFTPSCDWQPNPQFWHATDADATEHEVTHLVAAFIRALQPELVVETGTNSGQTARAIGAALKVNGHGRLVTMEIDFALVESARAACSDAGLPVTVVQMRGDLFIPPTGQQIGFLWLDSDAHARHQELAHYLPYLAVGAIVGVHDTAPQHPVHDYLQPLVAKHKLSQIRLRTPRGVSFLQAPW